MRNVRADQHGGFTLTDERRGSCDDGFGSRDLHSVEEHGGELSDSPLEPSPVVEELDKGNEEDDGGNDTEEEVVEFEKVGAEQESGTLGSECKQGCSEESDEVEDIVSSLGSQDKESENVLGEHTNDDGLPLDGLAVVGGHVETKDEDDKTEQTDSAVGSGVIGGLVAGESTDDEHSNGSSSSQWQSQLLGDHLVGIVDQLHPQPGDWLGDILGRDVQGNQTNGDSQPEEERDQPRLGGTADVVAM